MTTATVQQKVTRGARVGVRVPSWLAFKLRLVSMELEGTVEAVTPKALLFNGSAVVRESRSCLRCGREITNPASQLAGYGPECSRKLGIPREFSAEEIAAIRAAVKSQTKLQVWLPRAQVEVEVLEPGEPQAQQTSSPAVRVAAEDGQVSIRAPFRYKDRCKRVPGARWNKERKVWSYPATPAVAVAIAEAFDGVEVEIDRDARELFDAARAVRQAQEIKAREDLPNVEGLKTDAWLHQRRAYWFARQLLSGPSGAVGLFMDMGTGKSLVGVGLINSMENVRRALIVCPKSVVDVWPLEFQKHSSPEALRDLHIVTLTKGSVADKTREAKQALEWAQAAGKKLVLVINYESAWRDPFAEWTLKKAGLDLVLADEIHRIKAPGGKQSLYFNRLGKAVPYRVGLTGTPMPHSPLDIYAQYRFLDAGIFGTSFNRFKQRYAVMGGYGGYKVLDYQNQDELYRKMYRIAFRVESDDVLDLPELVEVERTCTLEPKARKMYEDLENDFIAWLESGEEVTAANALVKLLRLQQLTSGHLKTDEGELVEVSRAKRELLADVMEDLDPKEPVVVFCRFHSDIEVIRAVCQEQKRTCGELSGRRSDLDLWKRGHYNVLAVQIRSGGTGIDLTRSRYAIYYSLGFSLGEYEQSRKRVHRPGQTRTTRLIHLVASGTVDERVLRALEQRQEVVQSILDWKGGAS